VREIFFFRAKFGNIYFFFYFKFDTVLHSRVIDVAIRFSPFFDCSSQRPIESSRGDIDQTMARVHSAVGDDRSYSYFLLSTTGINTPERHLKKAHAIKSCLDVRKAREKVAPSVCFSTNFSVSFPTARVLLFPQVHYPHFTFYRRS
jgi:hypothetical protein